MGIFGALTTAVAGMRAQSFALENVSGNIANAQTTAFHASCVGKTLPVLIERPGRMPGQVGGRSPYLQAVHLEGSTELIGAIHQVEIVGTSTNSLVGRLRQAAAA